MAMTLTLDDETAALLTAEAGRHGVPPAEMIRALLPGRGSLTARLPAEGATTPVPGPPQDNPPAWVSGFTPEFTGMLPSQVLAIMDDEEYLAKEARCAAQES